MLIQHEDYSFKRKSVNPDEVNVAVSYAIAEARYRHIDCAAIYGNEPEIGIALNRALNIDKIVNREDIWITSKLWCTKHHPDDVESACLQTLEDLKLDYLDLYLIHWPVAFERNRDNFPRNENGEMSIDNTITILQTWKAMEKLVEKGLVKHIGVSNFTIELLEKMIKSGEMTIMPYANQVELHLYMQQEPLIEYCNKHNIKIIGYSTLGSGDAGKRDIPVLLKDEVLNEIAKETGKSVAQVELRFLHYLSPEGTLATLAKSVSTSRIMSNNQLDFELTQNQIQRLKARDRCFRYCDLYKIRNVDIFGDHW